jgi:hypothetical protein
LFRLFPIYATKDIDLALRWHNAQGQGGHHFLSGINLSTQQNPLQLSSRTDSLFGHVQSKALFESSARETSMLITSLANNRQLKDDIPIEIHLHSAHVIERDFSKSQYVSIYCSFTPSSYFLVNQQHLPAHAQNGHSKHIVGQISQVPHRIQFTNETRVSGLRLLLLCQ